MLAEAAGPGQGAGRFGRGGLGGDGADSLRHGADRGRVGGTPAGQCRADRVERSVLRPRARGSHGSVMIVGAWRAVSGFAFSGRGSRSRRFDPRATVREARWPTVRSMVWRRGPVPLPERDRRRTSDRGESSRAVVGSGPSAAFARDCLAAAQAAVLRAALRSFSIRPRFRVEATSTRSRVIRCAGLLLAGRRVVGQWRVGLILFGDGGLAHGVGLGAGRHECAVFCARHGRRGRRFDRGCHRVLAASQLRGRRRFERPAAVAGPVRGAGRWISVADGVRLLPGAANPRGVRGAARHRAVGPFVSDGWGRSPPCGSVSTSRRVAEAPTDWARDV